LLDPEGRLFIFIDIHLGIGNAMFSQETLGYAAYPSPRGRIDSDGFGHGDAPLSTPLTPVVRSQSVHTTLAHRGERASARPGMFWVSGVHISGGLV
jgi:hypothetical protein